MRISFHKIRAATCNERILLVPLYAHQDAGQVVPLGARLGDRQPSQQVRANKLIVAYKQHHQQSKVSTV